MSLILRLHQRTQRQKCAASDDDIYHKCFSTAKGSLLATWPKILDLLDFSLHCESMVRDYNHTKKLGPDLTKTFY